MALNRRRHGNCWHNSEVISPDNIGSYTPVLNHLLKVEYIQSALSGLTLNNGVMDGDLLKSDKDIILNHTTSINIGLNSTSYALRGTLSNVDLTGVDLIDVTMDAYSSNDQSNESARYQLRIDGNTLFELDTGTDTTSGNPHKISNVDVLDYGLVDIEVWGRTENFNYGYCDSILIENCNKYAASISAKTGVLGISPNEYISALVTGSRNAQVSIEILDSSDNILEVLNSGGTPETDISTPIKLRAVAEPIDSTKPYYLVGFTFLYV